MRLGWCHGLNVLLNQVLLPNTQQAKCRDAGLCRKARFIQEAVKQGDRRTNLQSSSPEFRGLGYLWDKEAEWSQEWGNIIGGKKKVMPLVPSAGISELHASSQNACSENGSTGII